MNRIGIHVNRPDEKLYKTLETFKPAVIKLAVMPGGPSEMDLDGMQSLCPNTIFVIRFYSDVPIEAGADAFFASIEFSKFKGRKNVVFEGINEPMGNGVAMDTVAKAQMVNSWFVRWNEIIHAQGEKSLVFSFSTGNPPLELVTYLKEAANSSDGISLHEYGNPTGTTMLLRHRQFMKSLGVHKPVFITECAAVDDGANGGYLNYPAIDDMARLTAYNVELCQDTYVVGAMAYQYGDSEGWGSFNISKRLDAISKLNAPAGTNTWPTDTGNTIDDMVRSVAKSQTLLPINVNAALYKHAVANKLGYPRSKEFEFTYNSTVYVAQQFQNSICYTVKGDWGNIKHT